MHTDDGLVGLGETLGGKVTVALIETEIAPMFLGESPFDIEKMLAKATFVPLYNGTLGYCAIAALEVACWDLMGKTTGQPLHNLLGGWLHDEVPFAACQALPFALDTHITELGGEVTGDGVIVFTDRGTMTVPPGPGLGVELDPNRFAAARERYVRMGDSSVYEEDSARHGTNSGQIDAVMAETLVSWSME